MTREEILGSLHAKVRLQRNAAEKAEGLPASTPAQLVPNHIASQASGHGKQNGEPEIHPPGTRQCASRQQHRDCRNRQTYLFAEDYGKQHDPAILRHECANFVHCGSCATGLSYRPTEPDIVEKDVEATKNVHPVCHGICNGHQYHLPREFSAELIMYGRPST
jgi:hypothetical protein